MVSQNTETNNSNLYCTFRLSERLFGVNILDVKEVNAVMDFTPIFHAPEEIKGYVNIRGQIYLILDLRLLMDLDPIDIGSQSRLILFKNNVLESIGVLVDQVGEVVEVEDDQIEERRKARGSAPEGNDRRKEFSNIGGGVCKLKNELMVVVNAKSLVHEIKMKFQLN